LMYAIEHLSPNSNIYRELLETNQFGHQ